MKISRTMNLDQLAERIGYDATREEAASLRDELVETYDIYETTEEIPEQIFLALIARFEPGYDDCTDAPADDVKAFLVQ